MTRAASEDRRPGGVFPVAEPPEAPERRPAAILFPPCCPGLPLDGGGAVRTMFTVRLRRGIARAMRPGGQRVPATRLTGHAPRRDRRPLPTAGSPLRRGGGAD